MKIRISIKFESGLNDLDKHEVRWSLEMIRHDPKSTLWYLGYAFGILKRGILFNNKHRKGRRTNYHTMKPSSYCGTQEVLK